VISLAFGHVLVDQVVGGLSVRQAQSLVVIVHLTAAFALGRYDIAIVARWAAAWAMAGQLAILVSTKIVLICNVIGSIPLLFVVVLLYRVAMYYAQSIAVVVVLAVVYSANYAIVFLPGFADRKHSREPVWAAFAVLAALCVGIFGSPFGNRFDIHIIASHVVNPSGRSYFAIAPEAGVSIARFLARKAKGVTFFKEFGHVLHTEPSVVEFTNATLPAHITKWPEFELKRENGSSRYTFRVADSNPGLHKSAIVVKCPGKSKCVTEVDGFQNITSFIDKNERRYVIRHCPAFHPHAFSFTLNATVSVPVDITFSYHELSPELKEWLTKFPGYVAPFAQADSICDTVLVKSVLL
jgi:hypothetical protein